MPVRSAAFGCRCDHGFLRCQDSRDGYPPVLRPLPGSVSFIHDNPGVFGRGAASTPGYHLQSLRDSSKRESNLLDSRVVLRSNAELCMMDGAVRGLKPTATLTQSLRDPEGEVPLSASFVEHSDLGHPQKKFVYPLSNKGFSIMRTLNLTSHRLAQEVGSSIDNRQQTTDNGPLFLSPPPTLTKVPLFRRQEFGLRVAPRAGGVDQPMFGHGLLAGFC